MNKNIAFETFDNYMVYKTFVDGFNDDFYKLVTSNNEDTREFLRGFLNGWLMMSYCSHIINEDLMRSLENLIFDTYNY